MTELTPALAASSCEQLVPLPTTPLHCKASTHLGLIMDPENSSSVQDTAEAPTDQAAWVLCEAWVALVAEPIIPFAVSYCRLTGASPAMAVTGNNQLLVAGLQQNAWDCKCAKRMRGHIENHLRLSCALWTSCLLIYTKAFALG